MKDLLLDDARDFLQSKEWYSDRGIPFRRGYLLVSSHNPSYIAKAYFVFSMARQVPERHP